MEYAIKLQNSVEQNKTFPINAPKAMDDEPSSKISVIRVTFGEI